MGLTRQELFDVLRKQSIEIEFVKQDGTVRKLVASLEDRYIGQWQKETITQMSVDPSDILRVWSVTDGGWRTVILNNINYISPITEAA